MGSLYMYDAYDLHNDLIWQEERFKDTQSQTNICTFLSYAAIQIVTSGGRRSKTCAN